MLCYPQISEVKHSNLKQNQHFINSKYLNNDFDNLKS
jgi:hypothetical protein